MCQKTILVVDDSKVASMTIQMILRTGYECVVAEDGVEAVEKAVQVVAAAPAEQDEDYELEPGAGQQSRAEQGHPEAQAVGAGEKFAQQGRARTQAKAQSLCGQRAPDEAAEGGRNAYYGQNGDDRHIHLTVST